MMRSAQLHSPQVREDESEADPERPAKRARTSTVEADSKGIREVGLMRKNIDDNYASFLGSASGIHFIRSVYSAVGDKQSHPHQNNQTPESNLVPGEDDRLSNEIGSAFDTYLWHPREVVTTARPAQQSFDDMLLWTQSYFDNWHPAYPFLHAPTILEMLEKLAIGSEIAGDANQIVFGMAIIRSIMSISLADQRQLGHDLTPVPAELVFLSFKHATDSIDLVLSTKTSMLSLQALISVQLFLVSMLRHNAASRLGGLINRMVFHLGLHRCPSRYSAFSQQEIQLRQRLFWSVYCIDRHICQSLGLPLTLRDDDIDVCFLGHERHSQERDSSIDSRLQLLDLLTRHAEIKGLILESLHKSIPYRQVYSNKSSQIMSKLAKWSNEVDAYLDTETENEKPLTAFHEMVLGVLRHECVIALNRPLLAASKKDNAYHAALQTCVGAARSVITSLFGFLKSSIKLPVREDERTATPLLWPSFTWAVWMSAFILIYAAVEREILPQVAIRLTDRSLEILRHLSARGSVWPNACEVAIRELRVKLNQSEQLKDDQQITTSNASAERNSPIPNVSLEARPEPLSTRQNLPMEHDSPVYMMKDDDRNPNHRMQSSHSVEPLSSGTDSTRSHHPQQRVENSSRYTEQPRSIPMGTQTAPQSDSDPRQLLRFDVDSQASNQQQSSWLGNTLLPQSDLVDIFQGFEIPFWMGDDQYTDLINS